MGDRAQRVEGKAKELKGRIKRKAGAATGRPGTETRGAGDEIKGKAKKQVGKATGNKRLKAKGRGSFHNFSI